MPLARLVAVLAAAFVLASGPARAAEEKVLHIALPDIAMLDPQQLTDLYSSRVASVIFEGLYEFEYMSIPARVVPNTAVALPQITDNGLTWTIKLKPGIHFTDDPAFKGARRELVAQDYVYSIQRFLDPTLKGGGSPSLTDLIVGARPVIDAARKSGRMNYDARIEGLQATDRYTLRIRLTQVDYTLLERLASMSTFAVAREVVEAAGNDIGSRAVGTGPYRLQEWKRASRVVLVANRAYRPFTFPDPAGMDGVRRRIADAMKGRKLPALDRIEVSIMEEPLPELLAFDQGTLDLLAIGGSLLDRVLANGKLRPEFEKRGIQHIRFPVPAIIYTYFNLDDPLVGGNAPEKIALRRAIALGYDTGEMIRVFYAGQASPANQLLPPGVQGHDDEQPKQLIYDPAAARALLDRFGYKDRDGDGYRETPDGKPLVLVQSSMPDSQSRESDTIWIKSMKAIGLRMTINTQPFNELLKESLAGKLMMFNLGFRATEPSGYSILETQWGKAPPDTNRSRFRNADYDAAYEQFLRTPAGPDRIALARRMSDLVNAYVPITLQVFPIGNALAHPWLLGYYPSPFGYSWKYFDIDPSKRKGAGR